MCEKKLEKQIILALKNMGHYVYKTGSPGSYDYNMQFNEPGIADLIVMGYPFGCVFMEVKVEKRRNHKDGGLTGKQPEFKKVCEQAGIKYRIVYNLEEAFNAIS